MTKRHLPFAAAAIAMAVQLEANAMLEEVVVTATKRQQTLQEFPIAVSVVTAESIEQSQVLDIKDLQTLVPSLRVTQLQAVPKPTSSSEVSVTAQTIRALSPQLVCL